MKVSTLSNSFRRRLILVSVAAATVPVLLVAIALVNYVSAQMRRDANELYTSKASQLAGGLDRQFELTAARVAAIANDSDVRRAARVPIFISKADAVLQGFLASNPSTQSVIYLDQVGNPITAWPAGLDLEMSVHTRDVLRRIATEPWVNDAAVRILDLDNEALVPALARGTTGVLAILGSVHAANSNTRNGTIVALTSWPHLLRGLGTNVIVQRSTDRIEVSGGHEDSRDDHALSFVKSILADNALNPTVFAAHLPTGYKLSLIIPFTEFSQHEAYANRLFSLVAVLAVALVGFVALTTMRRSVHPLASLQNFVAEYAAGNYQAEAPTISDAELKLIVELISKMGARVRADIAETERRAERTKATLQAELDALKSQLNPHLLFNALNGIAAIAHDDGTAAAKLIGKLADLYRLILASSRQPMQAVSAELVIVQHYLDLEKLRLGNRLSYQIAIEGVDNSLLIPCLLLQTLVENCIKHGIAPSLTGGAIDLRLSGGGDHIDIDLRNTGEPFEPRFVPGTGLKNTVRRLDLLYPGKHAFSIHGGAAGQTIVKFRIWRTT